MLVKNPMSFQFEEDIFIFSSIASVLMILKILISSLLSYYSHLSFFVRRIEDCFILSPPVPEAQKKRWQAYIAEYP